MGYFYQNSQSDLSTVFLIAYSSTRFSDWVDEPLSLLAEIVQEDFLILEFDEVGACWRFAAGTACFSFVELGINGEKGFMKPGASLASIHQPVPGFNPTIHNQVTNYFRALRGNNAFWRANWIITPMEGVTPFEDEITGNAKVVERTRIDSEDVEEKEKALSTAPLFAEDALRRPVEELAVRAEYQTVFKLAHSGCLVFAVHSYIDPLTSLAEAPRAAEMVARTTANMDPLTLKYRGVNSQAREAILAYLSTIY